MRQGGVNVSGGGGIDSVSGQNHNDLDNLDYASAGHTGFVPANRQIATTTPLAGGGDLSADRNLEITPNPAAVIKFLGSFNNNTPEWSEIPIAGLAPYFFVDAASDIGGGYKQAKELGNYTPAAEASIETVGVSPGQLLAVFATNSGLPGVLIIPSGIVLVHFHAKKASPSTSKIVTIYFELYKRTSGGVETLICTGEESSEFTTTPVEYNVHALIETDVILDITDRIVLKFYAGSSTTGSPTPTIYYDGETASRVNVPVPAVDPSSYAPTTRTIETTAPLEGGGDLSANRTLSIPQADGNNNGYLDKDDWTSFNSKEPALTKGNLTGASPIVLSFTRQVIGGAAEISIPQADANNNGYLSSADWNNFNNGGGGGSAIAPFSETFNNSGDWDGPAGGVYTHNSNHNLSSPNLLVEVWDSDNNNAKVFPQAIIQTNNNSLQLQVAEVPDSRFAGRVVVQSSAGAAAAREVLTAARTYYVRTDGNDSNDGLANTAGGAFLTIQHAIDVVSGSLDLSTFQVTIQVGAGTYNENLALESWLGKLTPILKGDSTTPSNVVISVASGDCITNARTTHWIVDGFKVISSSGSGIVSSGGKVFVKNIDYGACGFAHNFSLDMGHLDIIGNCEITGNAVAFIHADRWSVVSVNPFTITLTGTPAFSNFVQVYTGMVYIPSVTFSGSATGTRYYVSLNGVIYTGGGGSTYLPGNSAGSAATGGQYN
jgi:hypothetical protein